MEANEISGKIESEKNYGRYDSSRKKPRSQFNTKCKKNSFIFLVQFYYFVFLLIYFLNKKMYFFIGIWFIFFTFFSCGNGVWSFGITLCASLLERAMIWFWTPFNHLKKTISLKMHRLHFGIQNKCWEHAENPERNEIMKK